MVRGNADATLSREHVLSELANDPTNAERQQRWRDRLKGAIPPAPKLACVACGKSHTGARGVHCSRCWEKHTPEGREFKRQRVYATRARQKAGQTPAQP